MSPTLLTHPAHPARINCTACPGNENATLGRNKSITPRTPGSATVGRSVGRRSLDAFSSIRGSLKGPRRALNTTTNQKPAVAPAMTCASTSASPFEPAKQKWYDSLRGKSSQIPLPSTSPISMSSTLKRRTRFFRSPPAQPPTPDLSAQATEPPRAPLPKLELASFQADLRRMSLFGEATEQSSVDEGECSSTNVPHKIANDVNYRVADLKPNRRDHSPKKTCRFQAGMESGMESKKSQDPSESREVVTSPATGTHHDEPELEKSKQVYDISHTLEPISWLSKEPWRVLCDLYYKGTPSEPERKKGFQDASAALAEFALRHMLSESRDCSPTLLWTGDRHEACGGKPRVHQAFNVYPLIDGPRRIELAKQPVNLHWAMLTFTDGPPTVKSTDTSWEDERFMAAVRSITSMGYHVDVWSSYDDNGWGFDIAEAESQHRQIVKDRKPLADRAYIFTSPVYLEHRQRYEACMRHGLAGFNQEELTYLDRMQSEILVTQQLLKESSSDNDFVLVSANPDQEDGVKLAENAPATTWGTSDPTYWGRSDPLTWGTSGWGTQTTSAFETKGFTELHGFLEHMEESITEEK